MQLKDTDLFIFDMDGVLVDTERIFMENMVILSKKEGYNIAQEDLLNIIGQSNKNADKYMKSIYGENFDFIKLAFEIDKLFILKAKQSLIPLKLGVIEILDFLKKENKKIALASSSNFEKIKAILENTDIYNYFDYIISGESLKESKPNPEIFSKVLDYFNVKADKSVVFEDSLNGLKASKSLGSFTVFIPDIVGINNENSKYYDKVCNSLSEVLESLKNRKEV
ncbi:HAD family hydrolase [Oceanivirga salmonicida]|uniref:HAD family hydrolase n=1 Tax=Oceanivirga salmonicida TaxID=1769291 RepID=UPI0018CC3CFB|nr:HAD family phosphatase [Oceanivirga salmonicida]